MPVDGRPFRTLKTPSGAAIKCGPPTLRPLALGITGQAGTVAQDQPTHTIDVYVALGTPPADLADNVVVTVDTVKGKPREAFRVLRNGIDRQAGIWTLYCRTEDGYVAPTPADPATPDAPPADDGGYWSEA